MKPSSNKIPDTTQRKAEEAKLSQSEERYLALFDRSLDCVYLNDFAGNFLDANQSALDLLGYQREDIARLNFAALLTEDQLQLAFQVTEEVKATGRQKHPAEFRIRAKDGRLVEVEVQSSLIYKDGKPFAVQGIARDISERKLAEARLRESQQQLSLERDRLDLILKTAQDGFWLVDAATGRLVDINAAAADMLGYSRAELLARSLADIDAQWSPAELVREMQKIKTAGSALFETRHRTKGGQIIDVEISVNYLPVTDQFFSFIRDITAHKRAQAAVQKVSERLQIAARAARIGIWDWNVVDNTLVWDDAIYEIYGGPPGSFKGGAEEWIAHLHPDDRSRVNDELQAALRGEREYAPEFRIVRPDGSIRHLKANSETFFDANGKPVRMVGTNIDITARKQAEEAMQLDSAMMHNMTDGVQLVRASDGTIIHANAQFERMFGYEPGELIGRPVSILNSPDADGPEAAAATIIAALNKHGKWQGEIQNIKKDGTLFWCAASISIFEHASLGKLWVTAQQDITERKEAKEKLQTFAHRLALATHAGGVGIWDYEVETNQLIWDDQMFRLYGITREQFGGAYAAWQAGVHPEDQRRGDEETQAALRGEKDYDTEFRVIWPDGSTHYIRALATVERDAAGKALRMVGTNWDITERKAMEEAMRAKQNLIESIIHTMPVRVFWKDYNLVYLGCNTAFAQDAGFAGPPDVIGKDDFQLGWREQADLYRRDDLQVIETGVSKLLMEEPQATPEGKKITLLTSKLPLRDANGKIIGILGAYVDITERKQAEEQLRESESKYARLVEGTPDIIYTFSSQRGGLYYSKHVEAILGYSAQHLLEQPYLWQASIEPADLDRVRQAVQKSTAGESFDIEYRIKDSSGQWHWLRDRTFGRRQQGDEIIIDGIATDITERKLIEESHNRLATAVEQAAEIIFITDTKGTMLYANPAFEKTTGYTRAEVIGQNPRLLKSGKQDAAFYNKMWDTLQRGEAWEGHFKNKRKDGSLYEEEATISPIRDATGKIVNYVAVKRDVTHEMELEGQLRQSQKMEAMGTLAGGIAHDFNNILNVIFGYSNLLQLDLAGKKEEMEKLGEILKAGERAKDLVQQILTFSRQREQERRVIQLNSIIKETAKLLRASLPANLEIETELAADVTMVLADATQIYQVIMNLGTNALHAMEQQAVGRLKIALDTFKPDAAFLQLHPELRAIKYARLTISDNGCGMDEKTLARIYDPFFTTKPAGKGTGLGLAVVYGIVEAHDGMITVESQPGQGTTFRIYLPERNQDMLQDGIPESLIPCGQGQKILMVDDEAPLVGMYQKLFKALKYEGTIVTDPEAAVALIRKNPGQFDLVITDLTMPKLSGLEVARRIREICADMPVILATGFQGTVSDRQLTDAGICEVMEKPISMANLAMVLRGILGKKPEA